MKILEPSIKSLHLEMMFNNLIIATGTGFVIKHKEDYYLITNRHNVTGRNPITNEPLDAKKSAIPNKIGIWHNVKGKPGDWVRHIEPLFDQDASELWIEHPILKNKADFVALLLTQIDNVDFYPYDLIGSDDIYDTLKPTDMISVVGFPFGLASSGKLAIWSTGFVASELSIDIDNLPIFLVDCRTRQGQSGSAVIYHRNPGGYSSANGFTVSNSPVTKLLGIYSGRIRANSDLGLVWKIKAIQELVRSL